MSDLINANPNVKDADLLPKRESEFGHKLTTSQSTYRYLNGLISKLSVNEEKEAFSLDGEASSKEKVDSQEIYDLISSISDPEHPLTLGQLSVVNLSDIEIRHPDLANGVKGTIKVLITPTITHCSLATLIGLGIRVRLQRSVSELYRLTISVKPGTHQSESQVNKQLNDKERVAAACENTQLVNVIGKMLVTCKVLT